MMTETDYNDEIMNMLALGAGAVSAYKTYAGRRGSHVLPDALFSTRVKDFDRMEDQAREFVKNHLHEIEAIPDMITALREVGCVCGHGIGDPRMSDHSSRCKKIRDAIKKAMGKERLRDD